METEDKKITFEDKINKLAIELCNIETDIEKITIILKKANDYFNIKNKEIVELMEAEGFSSGSKINLKNGRRLEVKEYFNCSIPSTSAINKIKDAIEQQELIEKRNDCLTWLNKHNLDGIIKNIIVANFNKEEKDKLKELLTILKEKNIECKTEETVNPKTLQATFREILKDGAEIPFDLFNISSGIVVNLK
jgi:hypothetical protein